jgi:hypothetical protein
LHLSPRASTVSNLDHGVNDDSVGLHASWPNTHAELSRWTREDLIRAYDETNHPLYSGFILHELHHRDATEQAERALPKNSAVMPFVIPAKAGIHSRAPPRLDTRLRGYDGPTVATFWAKPAERMLTLTVEIRRLTYVVAGLTVVNLVLVALSVWRTW